MKTRATRLLNDGISFKRAWLRGAPCHLTGFEPETDAGEKVGSGCVSDAGDAQHIGEAASSIRQRRKEPLDKE